MDTKDVENLARLARIELGEGETENLLQDMRGILEYVKQIDEMETSNRRGDNNMINVWRDDIIEPRDFSQESIVGQFPDRQDGFLKVKKIL